MRRKREENRKYFENFLKKKRLILQTVLENPKVSIEKVENENLLKGFSGISVKEKIEIFNKQLEILLYLKMNNEL